MKAIQISIPMPCHENWNAMTPTQKGRFCSSCEKEVFDFTVLSDAAILSKVSSGEICARVSETQLNRTISSASDARNKWMAAGFASIFALMSQSAVGQKKIKAATVKQKANATPKTQTKDPFLYGQVCDGYYPVRNATVLNKNNMSEAVTDNSGNFKLRATDGDSISVQSDLYREVNTVLCEKEANRVFVYENTDPLVIKSLGGVAGGLVVVSVEKISFFGRVFHKIGSWFK